MGQTQNHTVGAALGERLEEEPSSLKWERIPPSEWEWGL